MEVGGFDWNLAGAFTGGVVILLLLILLLKWNAFVSLLISSIVVGWLSGMPGAVIIDTIKSGMGGTLGFVSIVIGLGAIFGEILRASGSTEKLSAKMLSYFGIERSPIALSISGFLIAIPVFFDVAFIILIPVLYALQKKTGKSLLYFAIPLLASLAITHAFIPPTPGPIAVADILGADLGRVIGFGILVGLPTTWISGIIYGKFIANRIHADVPKEVEVETENEGKNPPLGIIVSLIALPIALILFNTLTKMLYPSNTSEFLMLIQFLGNPIIALIISVIFAWYLLGQRMGFTKNELQRLSIKALGPAGIIILITGAGGVFKQMLIETGAGEMMAIQLSNSNLSPLLLAYLIALIVRVIQGSATVAMITAAGIMAPILLSINLDATEISLMVLIIAAGASGFSHVNDSGFWLVNRYLGLSEVNTLKSWTVMTGILSVFSAALILILSVLI